MEGLVTMSNKELDRMLVLDRVLARALTQRAAAEILDISDRQIRRMLRAYEVSGAPALASKRRGKPSNRKLPEVLRATAIELVRTRYADFGPTLAAEKLAEVHGVCVSVETLRKWMRDAGLWISRLERRRRPQPPRYRRECLGELIQIDGSDHEWFEGRGPRCTLLVFVDDATGRIMQLYFARSESTFDYFAAMTQYLRRHGRPIAFYSDKASIFRVNRSAPKGGDGITQLGRAMQSLNIDLICANTPAAKGRVERAHQTLQDRLVKELRLRDIVDRDAANTYAPEFADSYNQRFARVPRNDHDAHRPLQPQDDLERIFTLHDKRRLTSNLTLHYNRVLYVVEAQAPGVEHARGKLVDVRELENGEVVIEHNGTVLPARIFPKESRVRQGAIVENKLLGHTLNIIRELQDLRDKKMLSSRALTLREEDFLRRSMGESGQPHRRPRKKQSRRGPSYARAHEAIAAWAKSQQRPRSNEEAT